MPPHAGVLLAIPLDGKPFNASNPKRRYGVILDPRKQSGCHRHCDHALGLKKAVRAMNALDRREEFIKR